MTTAYRYFLIGAGEQTRAVAYALAAHPDTAGITVADIRLENATALVQWMAKAITPEAMSHITVAAMRLDASNVAKVTKALSGFSAVVNCAGNTMNVAVTRAAIAAGCHGVDIGQVPKVITQQFTLHDEAAARGVRFVPACGIAPGSQALVVEYVLRNLPHGRGDARAIRVRCGGIPAEPKGKLRHRWSFSTPGLITEYTLPCDVIRGGKATQVAALSHMEIVDIPGVGKLEAAATGGNTGTIIETLIEDGFAGSFDYKTLRYRGHWQIIRTLNDLSLLGEQSVVDRIDRELRRYKDDPDFLALQVSADDRESRVTADLLARHNARSGLSAMQQTTGFSAAIIARMLATGEITEVGVLRQERVVPIDQFLRMWERMGLRVSLRFSRIR